MCYDDFVIGFFENSYLNIELKWNKRGNSN